MKVSVIIPCYNVEKYISDCIFSLEKQIYNNLEVFCINDGSNDQTVTIIKDIIPSLSIPVKLINQENNGAPNARNEGLNHITGDYVQFLDADDVLEPEKLYHQVNLIKENNLPDLVIGSYQKQNMGGDMLECRRYSELIEVDYWLQLMKTDLGITSSNLFKSTLFKNGTRWNENLKSSQEYELMFQMLKMSPKIIFDSKAFTIIRERKGQISQSLPLPRWVNYLELRLKILEFLKQNQKEYYFKNKHLLSQIIFDIIRIIAKFDLALADRYYKKELNKFQPSSSDSTSIWYVLLFSLFGFKTIERIKIMMKHQ